MWFNKKQDKTKSEIETRDATGMTISGLYELLGLNRKTDALKIATAYACIRLNSNAMAQTPIHLYKMKEGLKTRVYDHPILKLLKRPYFNMTKFSFFSTINTMLNGHGDSFAYIVRENGIDPTGIIYIPNSNVSIIETSNDKRPYYYSIQMPASGLSINVPSEDVLHFKNISIDGIRGISPIAYNSMVFDTAKSEEEYKKYFYDNASQINGVIEFDMNLREEAITQIRENFGTIYSGKVNAGKTAILANGGKYKQVKPLSPADTDLINSRKMTNEDIMKIYGVPPPMLGDVSATYANSEQLALIYQEFTLSPMLEAQAEELTLKLFPDDDNYILEYVPDLSKMATMRDRAETQAIYKREGIYTADEMRARNGHAPIKGGDKLTMADNFGFVGEEKNNEQQ